MNAGASDPPAESSSLAAGTEEGAALPRCSGSAFVDSLRTFGHACQRSRRGYFVLFLATWMGMIWLFSSVEGPRGGERPLWLGVVANLAHAPLFGMLAFIALPLLPRRADGWPRLAVPHFAAVVTGVLAYGWVDEWHQSWVPERTASTLDMITDGVGASCVLWIAVYLGRPNANAAGLRVRLLVGVLACVGAALLSSFGPSSW